MVIENEISHLYTGGVGFNKLYKGTAHVKTNLYQ